ncbi:hypothetical protein CEXT_110971 [Caerostris extrusa]|uniref:Uncharacterized protein n=1 Tax=Caerostris extrusa TaxID=172846 RepID=A0AAV4X3R0_CAEEX|nr:hypothetical protein CEXT_110971 [Caerostris extrusa]
MGIGAETDTPPFLQSGISRSNGAPFLGCLSTPTCTHYRLITGGDIYTLEIGEWDFREKKKNGRRESFLESSLSLGDGRGCFRAERVGTKFEYICGGFWSHFAASSFLFHFE